MRGGPSVPSPWAHRSAREEGREPRGLAPDRQGHLRRHARARRLPYARVPRAGRCHAASVCADGMKGLSSPKRASFNRFPETYPEIVGWARCRIAKLAPRSARLGLLIGGVRRIVAPIEEATRDAGARAALLVALWTTRLREARAARRFARCTTGADGPAGTPRHPTCTHSARTESAPGRGLGVPARSSSARYAAAAAGSPASRAEIHAEIGSARESAVAGVIAEVVGFRVSDLMSAAHVDLGTRRFDPPHRRDACVPSDIGDDDSTTLDPVTSGCYEPSAYGEVHARYPVRHEHPRKQGGCPDRPGSPPRALGRFLRHPDRPPALARAQRVARLREGSSSSKRKATRWLSTRSPLPVRRGRSSKLSG
jgi:hypothetical protein